MADFAIDIVVEGIPTGGFFNTLKNFFNVELRQAEKEIGDKLLKDAREEHRYTHQTRNLRNATKIKGRLTIKKGLVLYVDLRKADYAEYVINGHGSWKEDNFIYEAVERNKYWIYNRVQKAIDGAVVKFNRQK
jgi:hypothetical protein